MKHTCCFTGHRKLPADKIERMIVNLDKEIDNLIAQGVTDFISGGAVGFDQIAASLVVAKKRNGQTHSAYSRLAVQKSRCRVGYTAETAIPQFAGRGGRGDLCFRRI
ncbi:MAG: hypothetical protein LUG13_07460 [Oscillospiraceae bacterium]|nr:hypothetical protein [Oscillospiraceae bacterium]